MNTYVIIMHVSALPDTIVDQLKSKGLSSLEHTQTDWEYIF